MSGYRRLNSLGGRTLVLVTAVAALGCPRIGDRLPPPRTNPQAPAPVEAVPPPPPPAPLPSEADVAIEAARIAEVRGDHQAALAEYRRATTLTLDNARLASVHYALGVLQADPAIPERNLEESRAELQRFLGMTTDDPREREARVIAALIDEATQLRSESSGLKTDIEALKSDVAALKTKLDEKEKELAGIKKVLLQNKGKP